LDLIHCLMNMNTKYNYNLWNEVKQQMLATLIKLCYAVRQGQK
jgi:hypothetical protein